MNMLDKANKIADELVRLRRDIHANPELGFQEVRTAALVADTLREIGVEVEEGVGRTGVVGTLGSGDGFTVGIRADMDALPITQANNVDYKSTNEGVMHACGHDAHTAMLLGVAHLLKQSSAEDNWNGTVKFLFQPSEESADKETNISGGLAMVNDGALDDVDVTLALHVNSTRPAGELLFADGYAMAAVDVFEGWVYGSGGHGAYPHTGTDPIYIATHVLNALYAIPSRYINPLEPVVVTVGQIHAGTTSNVIPNTVYIHGTIRSFAEETRERVWEEVERAFKVADVFGGCHKFVLHKSYPATYHTAEINDKLKAVGRDLVGEDAIVTQDAFGMGAEDFGYMTQKAPGAMFMLGAAIDDDVFRAHHTDIFDIDESVLPLGAAMLAETARRMVTE